MRGAAAALIVLSLGAGQPAPPVVAHIDHIMFTGGPELSGLVRILRDQFQLPVIFDGPSQTPPMPGTCLSLGNTCLEVVPLPIDPENPGPRRVGIGNLALHATDFASLPDALRARSIEHFAPAKQARWTTVGLRGLGIGFFIEYHDGMAARRAEFRRRLEERQGGALGIVRVLEIAKRAGSIDEVRPAWARLLGEPVKGDENVWTVGDGLAVRLVASEDVRTNRIVLQVRSREAAAAALRSANVPFTRDDDAIRVDAAALFGLKLVLR